MIVFEEYARLLLAVHAVCALLVVALSTHLVVWLHRYFFRRKGSHRSVLRFALLSTGFFALTMLLGLMLYPTYKVRVRGEFFDNPSAIGKETTLREQSRVQTRVRDLESLRYRTGSQRTAAESTPSGLSEEELADAIEAAIVRGRRTARWFDVKEHWVGLGLILSAAASLLLFAARKVSRHKLQGLVFAVVFFSVGAMLTTWAAAVIGIWTVAHRSV